MTVNFFSGHNLRPPDLRCSTTMGETHGDDHPGTLYHEDDIAFAAQAIFQTSVTLCTKPVTVSVSEGSVSAAVCCTGTTGGVTGVTWPSLITGCRALKRSMPKIGVPYSLYLIWMYWDVLVHFVTYGTSSSRIWVSLCTWSVSLWALGEGSDSGTWALGELRHHQISRNGRASSSLHGHTAHQFTALFNCVIFLYQQHCDRVTGNFSSIAWSSPTPNAR